MTRLSESLIGKGDRNDWFTYFLSVELTAIQAPELVAPLALGLMLYKVGR